MHQPSPISQRPPRVINWVLGALALGGLLLVVHNFGCSLLPNVREPIPPEKILSQWSAVYRVALTNDWGDIPRNWRNRAVLTEAGRPLGPYSNQPEIAYSGRGRWLHDRGMVVFATSDNSDPRTNGRTYALLTPLWYSPRAGLLGGLTFLAAVAGLYTFNRPLRPPEGPLPADLRNPLRWRGHYVGVLLVFAIGLYCNTGTVAPYAITGPPRIEPSTGFPINVDHPHFKVLFAFLDGAPRAVWDHAMLLRRILFPLLGWPLMKLLGFETGGTLAGLLLNVAVLAGFLVWLRRRVGQRGAVCAGWLLALSPGASYWVGLPYSYALIFPGSLLLLMGLDQLARAASVREVTLFSLGMGVLYLGYDFAPLFVPASVLVLGWRRQWAWTAVALMVQVAPLAAWIGALSGVFHQPLANHSSGIYRAIVASYLNSGVSGIGASAVDCWAVGWNTLFGANFIFLPALGLLVVAVNPLTSRVRPALAEVALLGTVAVVFLFNNLAPSYEGWDMHGSWIARLYQPAFAAVIVFVARWWQHRPTLPVPMRAALLAAMIAAVCGNALVVFGPILGDPGGVSTHAFYRFYFNAADPGTYDRNLRAPTHRVRLLGMPPPPRP